MKRIQTVSASTFARPFPPESFADLLTARYMPAPEVLAWARAEILAEGGQLHNPDFAHLEYADVQFLWAPGSFQKQGRTVLGVSVGPAPSVHSK